MNGGSLDGESYLDYDSEVESYQDAGFGSSQGSKTAALMSKPGGYGFAGDANILIIGGENQDQQDSALTTSYNKTRQGRGTLSSNRWSPTGTSRASFNLNRGHQKGGANDYDTMSNVSDSDLQTFRLDKNKSTVGNDDSLEKK